MLWCSACRHHHLRANRKRWAHSGNSSNDHETSLSCCCHPKNTTKIPPLAQLTACPDRRTRSVSIQRAHSLSRPLTSPASTQHFCLYDVGCARSIDVTSIFLPLTRLPTHALAHSHMLWRVCSSLFSPQVDADWSTLRRQKSREDGKRFCRTYERTPSGERGVGSGTAGVGRGTTAAAAARRIQVRFYASPSRASGIDATIVLRSVRAANVAIIKRWVVVVVARGMMLNGGGGGSSCCSLGL